MQALMQWTTTVCQPPYTRTNHANLVQHMKTLCALDDPKTIRKEKERLFQSFTKLNNTCQTNINRFYQIGLDIESEKSYLFNIKKSWFKSWQDSFLLSYQKNLYHKMHFIKDRLFQSHPMDEQCVIILLAMFKTLSMHLHEDMDEMLHLPLVHYADTNPLSPEHTLLCLLVQTIDIMTCLLTTGHFDLAKYTDKGDIDKKIAQMFPNVRSFGVPHYLNGVYRHLTLKLRGIYMAWHSLGRHPHRLTQTLTLITQATRFTWHQFRPQMCADLLITSLKARDTQPGVFWSRWTSWYAACIGLQTFRKKKALYGYHTAYPLIPFHEMHHPDTIPLTYLIEAFVHYQVLKQMIPQFIKIVQTPDGERPPSVVGVDDSLTGLLTSLQTQIAELGPAWQDYLLHAFERGAASVVCQALPVHLYRPILPTTPLKPEDDRKIRDFIYRHPSNQKEIQNLTTWALGKRESYHEHFVSWPHLAQLSERIQPSPSPIKITPILSAESIMAKSWTPLQATQHLYELLKRSRYDSLPHHAIKAWIQQGAKVNESAYPSWSMVAYLDQKNQQDLLITLLSAIDVTQAQILHFFQFIKKTKRDDWIINVLRCHPLVFDPCHREDHWQAFMKHLDQDPRQKLSDHEKRFIEARKAHLEKLRHITQTLNMTTVSKTEPSPATPPRFKENTAQLYHYINTTQYDADIDPRVKQWVRQGVYIHDPHCPIWTSVQTISHPLRQQYLKAYLIGAKDITYPQQSEILIGTVQIIAEEQEHFELSSRRLKQLLSYEGLHFNLFREDQWQDFIQQVQKAGASFKGFSSRKDGTFKALETIRQTIWQERQAASVVVKTPTIQPRHGSDHPQNTHPPVKVSRPATLPYSPPPPVSSTRFHAARRPATLQPITDNPTQKLYTYLSEPHDEQQDEIYIPPWIRAGAQINHTHHHCWASLGNIVDPRRRTHLKEQLVFAVDSQQDQIIEVLSFLAQRIQRAPAHDRRQGQRRLLFSRLLFANTHAFNPKNAAHTTRLLTQTAITHAQWVALGLNPHTKTFGDQPPPPPHALQSHKASLS